MASSGILPPPPFLPTAGDPATPWDDWILAFETYLLALGGGQSDPVKCALLRHCLGVEGQVQLRALQQSVAATDEGAQAEDDNEGRAAEDTEYDRIRAILTKSFSAQKGVVEARDEFLRRTQRQGESVMDYVAALRGMMASCRFGSFGPDEALVSMLTVGTRLAGMRERLLLEEDNLTADKAIRICRRVEENMKEAGIRNNS